VESNSSSGPLRIDGEEPHDSRDTHHLSLSLGIISDYPVIRLGLRALVEGHGWQVAFDRAVESSAVSPSTICSDMIVLDLGTTSSDRALALMHTFESFPRRPLFLGIACMGRPAGSLHGLFDAGLAAYVSLETDPQALIGALHIVAAGGTIVHIPGQGSHRPAPRHFMETVIGPHLSDREVAVLQLLGQGMVDRQVGQELGFSALAIKHLMELLERRECLKTRFQLGAWACKQGFAYATPRAECD